MKKGFNGKIVEDYYRIKEDVTEEELDFIRMKLNRLISRRSLLQGMAKAGAAASFGGLLAACGGSGGAKETAKLGESTGSSNVGKMTIRRELYPTYEGTPKFKPGSKVTFWRSQSDPTNLNPISRMCSDYAVCIWMYDWFVDNDPYSMEVIPSMAKKWEIKDDRIYTFHMRDDVKWWDGTPVTSEDVGFTVEAYRDEPQSSLVSVFKMVDKIEALDPLTLRVTLQQPYAPFLAMGMQMFVGRKKDFYPEFKGRIDDAPATYKPMGSGAWKFKEVVAGSHISFTANRDWWRGGGWKPGSPARGGPYIETLIQRHIADAESAFAAFVAGEIDTLWPVAPKDIDRLQDVDCWLYDSPSIVTGIAHFNFKNPTRPGNSMFNDLKIRQAFAHAIDREKLGKAVWRGYWEPRNSIAHHPWMLKPYEQTKDKYPAYDPKKAKDLLAQAGWKTMGSDGILRNDKGEPFKVVGVSGKTYLSPEYATITQQYLKEVGVDMSLEILDSAALRKRTRETRDFDIMFRQYFDWGYPAGFRTLQCDYAPPNGLNYGSYCSPKMEELWTKVLGTLDPEKAKAIHWEIQDLEATELPNLQFGVPHELMAIRKHVKGHQPNANWEDWDPGWMWID